MTKNLYLSDDTRLGAEHKKQLVEKVEKQTFEIVTLGLHVVHLCDLYAHQVCHVTEHSHRALLEGFLHRFAPCVQSIMQFHVLDRSLCVAKYVLEITFKNIFNMICLFTAYAIRAILG